jgi:hypothetical protein
MYRSGRAQFARREFYFEFVLGPYRRLVFPFIHPRLWWLCRRVWLHYTFGLPMPLTDDQKGRFYL